MNDLRLHPVKRRVFSQPRPRAPFPVWGACRTVSSGGSRNGHLYFPDNQRPSSAPPGRSRRVGPFAHPAAANWWLLPTTLPPAPTTNPLPSVAGFRNAPASRAKSDGAAGACPLTGPNAGITFPQEPSFSDLEDPACVWPLPCWSPNHPNTRHVQPHSLPCSPLSRGLGPRLPWFRQQAAGFNSLRTVFSFFCPFSPLPPPPQGGLGSAAKRRFPRPFKNPGLLPPHNRPWDPDRAPSGWKHSACPAMAPSQFFSAATPLKRALLVRTPTFFLVCGNIGPPVFLWLKPGIWPLQGPKSPTNLFRSRKRPRWRPASCQTFPPTSRPLCRCPFVSAIARPIGGRSCASTRKCLPRLPRPVSFTS